MVVFTAVRLGLFTALADKLLTMAEIAAQTGSNPHLLEPLLRACVGMELLEFKDNRFRNTVFSLKYLVEGKPEYVGDLIKLQYHEWNNWKSLYHLVLSDKASAGFEESAHKTFIKAMNNLGQLGEAEALTKAVDLTSCKRMVDVGGGSGLYTIALCKKYPELQVIILDKKETLEVTREFLKDTSVKSRITLREADIEKDNFGTDMDIVLLSDVIYDARLAELVLKSAFACLKSGGQLIIRGYYSDPTGKDTLFSRLFVLQELVFDPGRVVLNVPSLSEFVEKSGFRITSQKKLTERSQILIARKNQNK